jgi:ribonucleoside-diphosphate reductase alpha chain
MYLLLCGSGTGFSVQTHHVAQLPSITPPHKGKRSHVVSDSIEGWADALGVLLSSYFVPTGTPFPEFSGYEVDFDYSHVRPEGSPISWGGRAPGPKSLQLALENIRTLLGRTLSKGATQLRPVDAYDIVMHASNAVLSGGIRRSATLCLFSPEDEEMMRAKTGRWFIDNPQRGRSNNSVVLLRDKTTKIFFDRVKEYTKEFGEPGFVWSDNREALYNPCVEIGLYAYDEEGRSGWSFCNLCEINIKKAETPEQFLEACETAAFLGTLQAGYNEFPYLGPVTESIVRREALLGVSMTGMMDNPRIAFDYELQCRGAQRVLDINERVAKVIGIRPCARGTCIKPAGTTSCLLGTSSGIHPHHARRYFRRVQANRLEFPAQYFAKINPMAVEKSVWNPEKDFVLTFLCEVPETARIKNEINALSLLKHVCETQKHWVSSGKRPGTSVQPWLHHNVSNTITVRPHEWTEVFDFIYHHRAFFAGVSLLPESGDKDYPQAPFTAVLTPSEIVLEYGPGSIMASGLIVDGLKAFDDNLWAACNCVLDTGECLEPESLRLKIKEDEAVFGSDNTWTSQGITSDDSDEVLKKWLLDHVKNYDLKRDWIRRARQFAERYFDGDRRKMTYGLKDVNNWKLWCDLSREYRDIDWNEITEENPGFKAPNLEAGAACSGGKCEWGDLGITIEESLTIR